MYLRWPSGAVCLNYSESPMLLAGTTTWQRRKNHLLIKTVPKFTYVFQFVNNIYHSLSSLYEPVESVRPRIRTLFINIYHLQHLHPDNVSGRTLIHKFKINWGSNSRVPSTVTFSICLTLQHQCYITLLVHDNSFGMSTLIAIFWECSNVLS